MRRSQAKAMQNSIASLFPPMSADARHQLQHIARNAVERGAASPIPLVISYVFYGPQWDRQTARQWALSRGLRVDWEILGQEAVVFRQEDPHDFVGRTPELETVFKGISARIGWKKGPQPRLTKEASARRRFYALAYIADSVPSFSWTDEEPIRAKLERMNPPPPRDEVPGIILRISELIDVAREILDAKRELADWRSRARATQAYLRRYQKAVENGTPLEKYKQKTPGLRTKTEFYTAEEARALLNREIKADERNKSAIPLAQAELARLVGYLKALQRD